MALLTSGDNYYSIPHEYTQKQIKRIYYVWAPWRHLAANDPMATLMFSLPTGVLLFHGTTKRRQKIDAAVAAIRRLSTQVLQ